MLGKVRSQLLAMLPQNLKFQLKLWTAPFRVDPSFMIIGTQKGGTTSLWDYLRQNPHIGKISIKEINFFTSHNEKKLRWYKTHFPLRAKAKNLKYFDATPQYLPYPTAPARIHKCYPDMKFIVLLRNPVERAYSQYHHKIRNHHDHRTFAEALRVLYRLENEPIPVQDEYDSRDYNSPYLNYLARGKYVDQLTRWFAYFPKEQFLIRSSEYFYANTAQAMNDICAFIGVPHWEKTIYLVKNDGGEYPPIDPEVRKQLAAYFKPYNEKLYELLGTDYHWE